EPAERAADHQGTSSGHDWLGALGSCHGPRDAVVARFVVAVALRRIAVDEGPTMKRVGLAAHLVLDGEQDLARFKIDDILEAIFVIVDLGGEKTKLFQPSIGTDRKSVV